MNVSKPYPGSMFLRLKNVWRMVCKHVAGYARRPAYDLRNFAAGVPMSFDLSSQPIRPRSTDERPELGKVEQLKLEALRAEGPKASQALLSWPLALPDVSKTEIPRPELDELLTRLRSEEASITAVLGQPGAGKSAFLAKLGRELTKEGWTVLAIKADLIDKGVASEADLQKALGLGDTPSRWARQVSRIGPVAVLIDQLDALASVLDRHSQRLNVLLNLARVANTTKNIHIVLSCREFEYNHDTRLATVEASRIVLDLPAIETVIPILEKNGVNAAGWPEDAKEVIRSPQALAIYLGLGSQHASEAFSTYQKLLERLWAEHVRKGDEGPQLDALVTKIADHIASEEALWLAKVRFEDESGFERLLASRILVLANDGLQVGFSHQTLFEHALARSFVRKPGSLSKTVLEKQESLFLRSKVWTTLTYLRGAEPTTYAQELMQIWSTQGLRLHLCRLLIDFVGQQHAPIAVELRLMSEALADAKHRSAAIRAMSNSPGWFSAKRGVISEAMATLKEAGLMLRVIIPAWRFAPAEVERMVLQHWSAAGFENQAWAALAGAEKWSPELLDLAVAVVGRADVSMSRIDSVVSNLGAVQPEAALKLIRARLDKDLQQAIAEGRRRKAEAPPEPEDDMPARMAWYMEHNRKKPLDQLLESQHDIYVLPELVDAAPGMFLETLWPWFASVFAALTEITEERYWGWGFAHSHSGSFGIDADGDSEFRGETMTGLLCRAMELLAQKDENEFRRWAERLWDFDARAIQRILAHGLVDETGRFAELAFRFLTSDHRRFFLGSSTYGSGTTSRLIRVSSAFWSAGQLAGFERWVMAFAPLLADNTTLDDDAEVIVAEKVRMLFAIPAPLRSAEAAALIAANERPYVPEPRQNTIASFVGSPVSRAEMMAKSDDEILQLFADIPDNTDWDHPRDMRKGGNVQLSREFAEFALLAPKRGAAIIDRMDPAFAQRAVGYALEHLARGEGEAEVVMGLFLRAAARGFNSDEFRHSAAYAIERLVENKVRPSESVLNVLEGWLREAAASVDADDSTIDAEISELTDQPVKDPAAVREFDGQSILWDGGVGGSLPGGVFSIVLALTQARLHAGQVTELVGGLSPFLDRSDNLALWRAMLRYLGYMGFGGHQSVAGPFVATIFKRHPRLLGTDDAARLLAQILHWAPDVVEEQLAHWPVTGAPLSQVAYGEIVGYAHVMWPKLVWAQQRLEDVIAQPASMLARVGAVTAAAQAWSVETHRVLATDLFVRLVDRNEEPVWRAALDVFRVVEDWEESTSTSRLLESIAGSIDHIGDARDLFMIDRLLQLLPSEAESIARICEGLVVRAVEQDTLQSGYRSDYGELFNMAVTLHRLEGTREAGSRIFEKLLEADDFSVGSIVYEMDGRFKPEHLPSWPSRPRLRRGARRRRR